MWQHHATSPIVHGCVYKYIAWYMYVYMCMYNMYIDNCIYIYIHTHKVAHLMAHLMALTTHGHHMLCPIEMIKDHWPVSNKKRIQVLPEVLQDITQLRRHDADDVWVATTWRSQNPWLWMDIQVWLQWSYMNLNMTTNLVIICCNAYLLSIVGLVDHVDAHLSEFTEHLAHEKQPFTQN